MQGIKKEEDIMALSVKITKQNNGAVAELTGSLDTDTYPELENSVNPLISDPGVKVIVLNLQGLSYISSMGLGVVIKLKKAVEEKNGIFLMTNLQPQIKKVFEVVKALPGMTIFANIEEADRYLDKIQSGEIKWKE